MIRACIIDFKGNWDKHFPLVKFSYNNSLCSSISMAPCEALYGWRCRSPIGWFEVGVSSLLCPRFDSLDLGEGSYHKELVENIH